MRQKIRFCICTISLIRCVVSVTQEDNGVCSQRSASYGVLAVVLWQFVFIITLDHLQIFSFISLFTTINKLLLFLRAKVPQKILLLNRLTQFRIIRITYNRNLSISHAHSSTYYDSADYRYLQLNGDRYYKNRNNYSRRNNNNNELDKAERQYLTEVCLYPTLFLGRKVTLTIAYTHARITTTATKALPGYVLYWTRACQCHHDGILFDGTLSTTQYSVTNQHSP